ncbi:hypothetical protein HYH03_003072 [Edaphochlamys debaryana]|uniref:EF-hand domain-containing protein n=1 Tax=Edaphochlamys debaryana TaxID=47281 RepID=A0A836C3K0_9CHLO|nr:hypothetical protein HYH03_003072 [Edaphochlamys debaryana]|eukprot:KAG2498880.1 hypothetical protein HYH03_003072 [Edaphochlamys debaryana]
MRTGSATSATPPKLTKKVASGTKYSRAEVLELKAIFDKHDQDHNGVVTVQELIDSLESEKKLTRQELSAFRTIDINKDGVLTFDEYLRRLFPYANDREFAKMLDWARPKSSAKQEVTFEPDPAQLEEIRKMFKMFDKNNNGVIDKTELVAVAERCGYDSKDMEDLFKISDKDLSSTISFDEFVQLMKTSYI